MSGEKRHLHNAVTYLWSTVIEFFVCQSLYMNIH